MSQTRYNDRALAIDEPKTSKVEGIKERSHFLKEPVATELLQDKNFFSDDGVQILKFHGSYQQDNRDNRTKGQQEKDYQFMLRTRNPGGFVPPQLYLTLDELADRYGSGTLRATTRQGFQLHGVLKRNLKTVFAAIIKSMGSTLGACGDLNRNVMATPAPYKNRPEYEYARKYANNIADLLTPQTGAYYEIWLDGEKFISGEEDPEVKIARQRNEHGTNFDNSPEPIYGAQYMPRKFKICVTVPGDNSVDLYTQDLSLVVITSPHGELEGFNILAGGGLGRTHNKEDTFARLADEIGYVAKENVYDLVKAIVATQRDYGDRYNRRHARLKYLIYDWGVERFTNKVQQYFGRPIEPFRPLPQWQYIDFLGWHEQGDGKLFVGLSIENGRIKDTENSQIKTALREIVQKYQLPMLVTPHQNVLLYEIHPGQKAEIQQILTRYGIQKELDIDPLVRYAMACPALPTCGLAITESERALPDILKRIRALLAKVGLPEEHFVVRMTGCPNGCARPYVAELGLVGSAPDAYQVWLGGSPSQTRLAQPYLERLSINGLEMALEPIFVYYKRDRKTAESFGDWCDRIGHDQLRQFVNNYQSRPSMNTSETQEQIYTPPQPQPQPPVTHSFSVPAVDNSQVVSPMPPSPPVAHPGVVAQPQPVMAPPPTVMTPPQPVMAPPPTVMTPPQPMMVTPQPVMAPPQPVMAPPQAVSGPPANLGSPQTNVMERPINPAPIPSSDGDSGDFDTSKMRHRVSVRDEIYNRMKAEAKRQGKPLVQVATEAFEDYLRKYKAEE